MSYKPIALDVDKMQTLFDILRETQQEKSTLERAKNEAYNNGYNQAIRDCESSVRCSNYEYKLPQTDTEDKGAGIFYEAEREKINQSKETETQK